jgi:hypothetical protein
MIIREERDTGFLTGAIAEQKDLASRTAQTMAEQSPAFFSETLPTAFRIDNPVVSTIVSNAIKHIGDEYDPTYYPSDDVGQYEGTDYEFKLLQAKNPAHMQAMKEDITREEADRELLGRADGEIFARMAAGLFSPEILLPGGVIVKGAKGWGVAKSALSTAAAGGAAMAVSETALQLTQQTRPAAESAVAIGGGIVLGGILGGAVSRLSRSEFDKLSALVEADMKQMSAGDLSAAATEKLSLDELSIEGAGAQAASSATRIISPFNRMMNTPFRAAREAFIRMAEIPLKVKANSEGKIVGEGFAAETEIKLYEKGLAEAYDVTNKTFKTYKKREKSLGNRPITFLEYRERIAYAMRNKDTDEFGIEEINQAAQQIRKSIFDPLKKQAIELGLLPEDIEAKFADSYLTRVWSKEKLLQNEAAAREMIREWATEKIDIVVRGIYRRIDGIKNDPDIIAGRMTATAKLTKLQQELNSFKNATNDGFDEYIEDVVEEVFRKLSGSGDNEVPDFIAPITRGPLMGKLLDILDNRAAPFLQNDIGAIINTYTRQMGSEIALTRQFGRADMKDQIKAVQDEFQDMVKAAGENKELVKKLTRERDVAIRDLQDMRDLMRGTYKRAKDPDGALAQAGTVIKDLQYMSKMGGVTISSLPDMFRTTMVHGMERAFGDLISRLKMPAEIKKLSTEELKELGFLWETTLSSRLSTLADVSDPYARGTALTRFTGAAAAGFSRMTMINNWNDMMKSWAANVTQQRVLKNVGNMLSGKIDAKERSYLAYLGINEDVAKVINEQFKKHGRKEGMAYLSGIKNWDSTRQVEHAARVYKAALRKEADTIIVTRGTSEIPTFANSAAGSLILQFRSFTFSAHQRVLMRGLQDADANTAAGLIMMVAGGMVTAAIKKAERDVSIGLRDAKEQESLEDWSKSKWLVEGIDRSGVFALMWEANNIYEKAGGYGMTQMIGQPPASRFASRNVAGAIFGPTLGTVADAGSFVGVMSSPMTGRDVYKSDLRAMRNIVPFQNLIGVKHLFDAIEGGAGEALDAK